MFQLTCPKEVIDNANNLLVRKLLIGILIQLPVLTMVNERVSDVTDIVLKRDK